MKGLGNGLIAVGAILGLVGIMWLVTNAIAGILEPGGFVLGLFFILLFVLPVIAGGLYVRGRAGEEMKAEATFEGRRRLLERDRMIRQSVSLQATRAAEAVRVRSSAEAGEAAQVFGQAARTLDGLAADAAARVSEADWLHAAELEPGDASEVAKYDDLLLAALRRAQEEAVSGRAASTEGARRLAELARSAARQFALRQDLVLRGRRLPDVSPLNLIKGATVDSTDVSPESLGPGGAVSWMDANYLVTARITYFGEGRTWYALALRGEEGESRLQVEPGDSRALFLRPVAGSATPSEEASAGGTASASIESLSGSAEGVIVEYHRADARDGTVQLWERWPDGDKSFVGEWVKVSELDYWPAAVGTEA